MSKMKDLWLQKHEEIGEDFVRGDLSLIDAYNKFKNLGLDHKEILEVLDDLVYDFVGYQRNY